MMRSGQPPASPGLLRLRVADTFWRRLLGIHARGALAADEGLLLIPCGAVHTFFLKQPIDVVFLDAGGGECRRIHAMPSCRTARAAGARMVVELPAGFCREYPDYLDRIRAALRLRAARRPS